MGVLEREKDDESGVSGCKEGRCIRGVEGDTGAGSENCVQDVSTVNGGKANDVYGPLSDSSDGLPASAGSGGGATSIGFISLGLTKSSLSGRVISSWMRSNPPRRFTAYSGTWMSSMSRLARISERGREVTWLMMVAMPPPVSSLVLCDDEEPIDETDNGGVDGRVDTRPSEPSESASVVKRKPRGNTERFDTERDFELFSVPFVSGGRSDEELPGRGRQGRFTGLNASPAIDGGRACLVVKRRRGGVTENGRRRRGETSLIVIRRGNDWSSASLHLRSRLNDVLVGEQSKNRARLALRLASLLRAVGEP